MRYSSATSKMTLIISNMISIIIDHFHTCYGSLVQHECLCGHNTCALERIPALNVLNFLFQICSKSFQLPKSLISPDTIILFIQTWSCSYLNIITLHEPRESDHVYLIFTSFVTCGILTNGFTVLQLFAERTSYCI